MKGPRIGGLPSFSRRHQREEALDFCQESTCQLRDGRRRSSIYLLPALVLCCCTFIPKPALSAPFQVPEVFRDQMQNANRQIDDPDLPVFEQTAPNVTAFVGQTVYLPCRVRNLGDKVVSWMRSRDLHILTSSQYAFSSDHRFGPEHMPGSDAWTLRLDSARKSDSGRYECQVNTEPKIMYAVQLSVRDPDKPEGYDEPHSQQTRISYESTAPVAAIMGPREQRVPSGATITLRCVVTSPYQTRPIRGVQWLRDNKLLTFQAARGGINVETEKDAAQTVSVVTLASVTQQDVGKYTCRPTEGRADTVVLLVEEGERTEAMQRDAGYISSGSGVSGGNSSSKGTHCYRILFPLLLAGLLILRRNGQTFLH